MTVLGHRSDLDTPLLKTLQLLPTVLRMRSQLLHIKLLLYSYIACPCLPLASFHTIPL